MWQSLHDAWWRLATQNHPRSFVDVLACSTLHAGSLAYRAAVAINDAAYDKGLRRAVQLPCRVVSVGNVTVGGTGKTACVELITQKLLARGRRVAVLSRGYGGQRSTYWLQWRDGRLLVDGQPAASVDGLADEPQLLAKHLPGVPVMVGARRSETGRAACERFFVDTLVMDDGFQHRQVHRDCDIVLLQARMPLGGWRLLPRGPMREPLEAIKRAHIVVVTNADQTLPMLAALRERVQGLHPSATVVAAAHEPDGLLDAWTNQRHDVAAVDGRRVGLVSSIGDPAGFEETVRALHATIGWHLAFPDHHRYAQVDWRSILDRAEASPVDSLLTTEKDWVRLGPLVAHGERPHIPWWILTVHMHILDGESAFDDRLAGLYIR
jgi:tetraacyldisaccharide 4'-kinase